MKRSAPLRRTPIKRRRPAPPRAPQADYLDARAEALARDRYECRADGLHHPDCPTITGINTGHLVTHHVLPRERGGPDHVDNLVTVWNGLTPWGAGGCHGRIHRDQTEAIRRGLLRRH